MAETCVKEKFEHHNMTRRTMVKVPLSNFLPGREREREREREKALKYLYIIRWLLVVDPFGSISRWWKKTDQNTFTGSFTHSNRNINVKIIFPWRSWWMKYNRTFEERSPNVNMCCIDRTCAHPEHINMGPTPLPLPFKKKKKRKKKTSQLVSGLSFP